MTATSINRASGWREEGIFRPVGMLFEKLSQGIGGKYQYLIAHPGFRRSPTLTLARLLRWRVQCALGIPAILSLPEWNARFYLPPRWQGAGTTMIYALRSSYENELKHLSRFISPGMVVVDGGASCGIYTVAAAKLVGPSGLVLSFEPGVEAFSVLRDNIGLNGLKNVRIYRAALSDTEGKAALYHHAHRPNSFSLGPSEAPSIESEEVTIRTLSRAAQEEGAQRIDLIKLDVEGAEELVLHDAEQLIARSRPIIILEVNGIAAQRLGLDPIGSCRVLQKLGYTFFSLTEWGDLCPLDHQPLGNEIINLVAIHEKGRQ
jgi:FkbM family methyltransferase